MKRLLSSVVLIVALACAQACLPIAQPKPPQPRPPARTYHVSVHLFEGDPARDSKIVLADVHAGAQTAATGLSGDVGFDNVPAGSLEVCAEPAGYVRGCVTATVPEKTDINLALERATPPRPLRAGQVRLCGHAVCDDAGAFNALGASLFWGAWGYRFDRARLEENLAAIDGTADYIRVIADVGPDGWTDREIDPNWPDYRQVVEGLTDLAWDRYGIRVQWTIFGGSRHGNSESARAALVDLFADVANSRPEKVFAIEVANEAFQNFPSVDELRSLGRRLADRTSTIVALSDPGDRGDGATCRYYAGAGVDVATQHYDRDPRDHGFRPSRQVWGYPSEYEEQGNCGGQLPKAAFNNEPRGPQSSVAATEDPLLLVADYVTTFIAQNAAYVFHTGAGIRGGGREDLARGRAANLRDVPRFTELLSVFAAARSYLPPGLATWERHNAQWASFPFDGFKDAVESGAIVRAFMATQGTDLVGIVLGISRPVEGHARRAMHLDVLNPLDGAVLQSFDLPAGGAFTITEWPRTAAGDAGAVVLKGRFQ